MGKGSKWILRGISLGVLAVGVTGIIIGNNIALENGNNLDAILCPPVVDSKTVEKTQEKGQELSKQIVTEGAVLLKNNDNCLPLDYNISRVNVFGWSSIDWAYGANSSSCSGRVTTENDDVNELIDIYDALTAYEIEYNTELKDMYNRYSAPYINANKTPGNISNGTVNTLHEPDIENRSYYSLELLENALRFSDTAIVCITRNAGEDIPADQTMKKAGAGAVNENDKIYLDLSIEEEHLLTYVGNEYENVIVLISCGNTMDLSFLNTIPGLDAALQVGFTGTHGAYAIPYLLWGDATPSGHLADTVPYDRNMTFAMKTKPGARMNLGSTNKQYFEYIENIYVGYRWYETADSVGYWDDYRRDNILDEDDIASTAFGYDAIVQYPFGYGMSYTSFSWDYRGFRILDNGHEIDHLTATCDLEFDVYVTNTGSYSGKDVVEVYMSAPYYDGSIEKSSVQLVGFEKTIELAPGDSQLVTIPVDINDCLSYDCYDKNDDGHTGYELEKGDYRFNFMTDCHNFKKIKNSVEGTNDVDGIQIISLANTIDVYENKYTGEPVDNLFTGEDAPDGFPIDAIEGGYSPNYLTRSNFLDIDDYNGLTNRYASQKLIDTYQFTKAKGDAWDTANLDIFGDPTYNDEVVWGENHDMKIYENNEVTDLGFLLGSDYDDPDWDLLLEQVTVDETLNVINKSYGTPAINSVGKPRISELDGPAQIKCYYQNAPRGTGYPPSSVVAQTWNKELAEDFGLSFAEDMKSVGVLGLWGWGVNLHRNPVGGRNWEYFSEDPYLAGILLANSIRGLGKGGCWNYIKHFCLNDCEANKVEAFTFTTEQAYREIYLKPFQMGIQIGGGLGVMTSFNRIGALYSGGSEASITGVMRKEWGFRGSIITDWANNNGYMSIDHQLRAGGDLGMNNNLNGTSGVTFNYNTSGSRRLQHQMKEVVHHVLYTWLRAQYLNQQYNENPDSGSQTIPVKIVDSFKWWRHALTSIDVVLIGGLALFAIMTFIPGKKKEAETNE